MKAGLTYLKQQSKAEDKDGNKTLTAEEAQKAASKTKKKFAVFTSITPRVVGGKWVYDWKGSGGTLDSGLKGEEGGESTDVTTYVTNSKDGEGRPSKVIAEPLTWKAGNTKGCKPKENPLGWSFAQSGERKGLYVRGHLLNHNIHGPGEAWNLVPITRSMNSSMESQAESKGKTVLKEQQKIMFYETTVDSYYSDSGTHDHIYFPSKITVTWGDLKNGEQYDPKGAKTNIASKSFTQARPAMPYNINDLGQALLKSKLGFSSTFAGVITELRQNSRFGSERDFIKRINTYYEGKQDQSPIKETGVSNYKAKANEIVFDDIN